jgi:PAS domain S-box-containing protein
VELYGKVVYVCNIVNKKEEIWGHNIMKLYSSLSHYEQQAYIVTKDDIITEVSQLFIDIIEYCKMELLNKNISELFNILRVGPTIDVWEIGEDNDYFLFTKSLDARFVNITVTGNMVEKMYIFSEKENSRINVKFPALEALCSHNVFGIAIFSAPDITLLKANQTYLNFLDKSFNNIENSIGKKIHEIIPGWAGSSSEDIWRNVLSTEKVFYSNEYMFEFERGITYWDASLTPVFENDVLKYCIEITTDVTEKVLSRKKMEEQSKIIKEQNEKLKRQADLLNFSKEAVLAWELNGAITYWNRGAERKYGYDNESAIGSISHDLLKTVFPIDLQSVKSILVNKGFWYGEIEHTRRDGSKLIVETRFQLIIDEQGRQIVLETNRDITERKKLELELRLQKELLETILDSMQESIFVFDSEGNYVTVNKMAKERFSWKFKKLGDVYKAAGFYDLEGNIIRFEETPGYRVKCGETVTSEVVTLKANGSDYYTITNGAPIYDKNGNFLYGVISTLDITDLMKSQQTLKETQEKLLAIEHERNEMLEKAIEMKDEFLSIISHEFRTPLNVIYTAIQTLDLVFANEMTEKVKEYLQTIRLNTNRQLRLVNNLLDITRANSSRIKINKKNIDIVFLTKAITESVHEFASRKGISITFISKLTKKIIGIDDEKYERIILNLLSNAIKFTPVDKYIDVRVHSIKGSICIEVKDTGIGIPKDKLEVIFERFGQVDSSLSRQAEGTGIGLSLVKKFAEALGGNITVKSKVGKGTTFTILLPDETVEEEQNQKLIEDLMNDNRLVQTTNIEFSDIYL